MKKALILAAVLSLSQAQIEETIVPPLPTELVYKLAVYKPTIPPGEVAEVLYIKDSAFVIKVGTEPVRTERIVPFSCPDGINNAVKIEVIVTPGKDF